MKLFSKYFNLRDHDTSTSQTDRQTDDLPLQYRALRSIARCKRYCKDGPPLIVRLILAERGRELKREYRIQNTERRNFIRHINENNT